MQLGVTVSGVSRLFGDDLAAVVDIARAADEAGVDQVVVPDHLAMGTRLDRYPFGTFPYPPEEPWLEPLTVLAAMAAVTERVRLSTGLLIAPLRPALVVARTVATLDVLSRGRVDLGVGTGWQREEFTDLCAPFTGRADRMDDLVRACRALWEQEPPVRFTSPTVELTDLWGEPRPAQKRVPVLYGGGPTADTRRRIVELGDGWLPLGVPVPEIEAFVASVRDGLSAAGRDPAALAVRTALRVHAGDAGRVDLDATLAPLPELAAAGVTAVSVALGRFLPSRDDIRPFLRDLVDATAARTAGAS
jgi:probable F420-dependent oxidoreductase